MWPGTLCRGPSSLTWWKLLGCPGTVLPPAGLVLGTMLGQPHGIRFSHKGYLVHGLGEFGVEVLPSCLFPLHLEPALHGLPHRLDRGGLEDLALSKRTDHALTTRALGLGMASFRQMFLDEPFGHGLSIGVVVVGIQLGLDGFHLIHPDVRNHGQGLLSHGHKPSL